MKTTFENLEDGDLFRNKDDQIMVKGHGVFWNTGRIIECPEGSVGRFHVKANEPVFRLNNPEEDVS